MYFVIKDEMVIVYRLTVCINTALVHICIRFER